MIKKTLFHELTGADPSMKAVKLKPLTADTVNYFFIETGHAMEYYREGDEKIVALFFGPMELVLPSHLVYSRFKVFDGDMVSITTHGKMIRHLRRDPVLRRMYRDWAMEYRAKVAERLFVAQDLGPAERFAHLKETQPWVLELVEEEDVANYLGVEVGVLRRLRSGLKI